MAVKVTKTVNRVLNVAIPAIGDRSGRRAAPRRTSDNRSMSKSAVPRRRLLDFLGGSPTFVAEGCRVTGDIETVGPLVMCGIVRGDGHVRGALSLGARAEWEGEIRAERGVIAGKITGILTVEDKLEIGATAVIRARVTARVIAIAKGAVIDGELVVTSGQPVVSFEEKRSPAAAD